MKEIAICLLYVYQLHFVCSSIFNDTFNVISFCGKLYRQSVANANNPSRNIIMAPLYDIPNCKLKNHTESLRFYTRLFEDSGPQFTMGMPRVTEAEMVAWYELSLKYPVAVSNIEVIPILTQKMAFKKFMLANDLKQYVPALYESPSDAEYPCVEKFTQNKGSGGRGVFIAYNQSHLHSLMKTHKHGQYLLEEFISSDYEFTLNVVAFKGKPLACNYCNKYAFIRHNKIDRHVIAGVDNGYGEDNTFIDCTTLPSWETIHLVALAVIGKLKFNGFGFMQFKFKNGTHPIFIEMNGRIDNMLMQHRPNVTLSYIQLWWDEYQRSKQPHRPPA